MPLFALVLAASLAQAANPATDCATALARATSNVTALVCLGEEQFAAAQAAPKGSAERRQRLEAAAGFYRKATAFASDAVVKTAIVERFLIIFDESLLNDPREMESAFRELMQLKPTEVDPLFRFARFQEKQGAFDAAEETLLSARRLQPDDVEPFRQLAQFYARRATALHTQVVAKEKPAEEVTSPGTPDKNGVYQVGGGLTAPRRLGNAMYPSDATAAGIQGAVVAEVTVNELGVVTDARVLRSVPLLDEAALQAVREWRYDPTMVDGKPVPVKMTVTVNFSLPK